ncbi:cytochrome P450 [Mycena capillaripes]|nr:cytochrome P450 [Mycena capillaripes]
MTTVFYLVAFVIACLVVERYIAFRSASRVFGSVCPRAGVMWLHPFRVFTLFLAPWFPFKHQLGYYFGGFSSYLHHGSTCIGSVTLQGSIPTLWLSDAQAIKTIASEPGIFRKDLEIYEGVSIYGQHIITTEGADWKRHRKVVNPAFNEASNAFVWMETMRVVNEWFAEMDRKTNTDPFFTIDVVEDLTQVALLIVASAGFGRRASWKEDSSATPPPEHKMTFHAAVTTAVGHMFVKVLAPKWIQNLSQRSQIPFIGPVLSKTRESFESLQLHMQDLISLSRTWLADGKVSNMDAGLLQNLVEANMMEHADDIHHKKLTDDELVANVFAFLLAGHETSAHSLSFAIALLALYPDVQQKIYEETARVWPDGCPTSTSLSSIKEYMPSLQYTLATFQETIRLFPPAPRLGKIVQTDTTLTAHRFPPGKVEDVIPFTVPVPAGSVIVIDAVALHVNPIYWGRNAADFKPERFVDTKTYRWPRDAFFAFSSGPRSCIGQRFALTESVCILASLVRRYEISVPAHLAAKPFDEQKRVLLKWKPVVTPTPTNCVVQLRRRVA